MKNIKMVGNTKCINRVLKIIHFSIPYMSMYSCNKLYLYYIIQNYYFNILTRFRKTMKSF